MESLNPPGVEVKSSVTRRILIVAPSWIGDTILAQPLFKRLHERHPGLALDVLAPAWSAPLLKRMPEVRNVIDSPFVHKEFNLKARWQLGRKLGHGGYDEAIVLPNSWKSALIPFFAGIPKRTGFTGEARIGLLNQRHRLDKAALPQLAERYAQLAEALGVPLDRSQPLPFPCLTSSPEQQQAVCLALGLPLDKQPVVFCPGAEYGPAKRWPARHFAALATLLTQRFGDAAPICLIGSAKDAPLADEIQRLSPLAPGRLMNLCGRTTLEQAIDLIATARLVVSNDSGLMHVAASLQRPLLALYGSSSPIYTPPLSPYAKIISLNTDCSPCFKRVCPLGHFNCLEQLTPELVLQHL